MGDQSPAARAGSSAGSGRLEPALDQRLLAKPFNREGLLDTVADVLAGTTGGIAAVSRSPAVVTPAAAPPPDAD